MKERVDTRQKGHHWDFISFKLWIYICKNLVTDNKYVAAFGSSVFDLGGEDYVFWKKIDRDVGTLQILTYFRIIFVFVFRTDSIMRV